MHDLLITHALLYDGSGAPPVTGALAVNAGRIAAVYPEGIIPDAARETVDAEGRALMPGIVDNHTHYDAQITWDPTLQPSSALGVTTVILGNCGFGIAPCRPRERDMTLRHLTQVEGMSLEALQHGVRWDFETFPEYLHSIEARGCLLNAAAYIGHSAVRTYVMGEDSSRRAARPDEIDRMSALVREALQSGAIGFATSTSPAHNGEGGAPMPSRLAAEEELRRLVLCLKEAGHGVFMLTKGGHTPLPFLRDMCDAAGRPFIVAALLHNRTNPHGVFRELDELQEARGRGVEMVGAVSCCPLTMDFTMSSAYPLEGLQAWRPALGLAAGPYRAMLARPAFRQAVRAELAQPAAFRLFNGEWDEVRVAAVKLPRNARFEEMTVAQMARQLGKDPLDSFLDLALEEDLETCFTATLLNSDEEAVGRMLRHPASLVSLSDAGAHLTFFNDAGFGLHLIGHWARDRAAFTVEEAVRKLTSQPARLFGLSDRGLLRPGCAADLLMFDPARIGRGGRRKVRDLPAGAARLHTDPVGLHGVWVNGQRIVDEDGLRDNAAGRPLPGRLLRGFRN